MFMRNDEPWIAFLQSKILSTPIEDFAIPFNVYDGGVWETGQDFKGSWVFAYLSLYVDGVKHGDRGFKKTSSLIRVGIWI